MYERQCTSVLLVTATRHRDAIQKCEDLAGSTAQPAHALQRALTAQNLRSVPPPRLAVRAAGLAVDVDAGPGELLRRQRRAELRDHQRDPQPGGEHILEVVGQLLPVTAGVGVTLVREAVDEAGGRRGGAITQVREEAAGVVELGRRSGGRTDGIRPGEAACAGSPYPRDLGSRSERGLGGGMTMGLAASR